METKRVFHIAALTIADFLAIARIVLKLPLNVAALFPRYSLPAVVTVLAFIALATWYELQLLLVAGSQFPIASYSPLVATDFVQAAWVLAVVGMMRTSS